MKGLSTEQSVHPRTSVNNRQRRRRVSSTQGVWTTLWAGLVHSGWDTLMVGWHLHRWAAASRPRGWVWQSMQLKMLCHTVRSASLHVVAPCPAAIPLGVQQALVSLAWKRPTDGFAFSRLSRGLPPAPQGAVGPAVAELRAVQTTKCLTSDESVAAITSHVISALQKSPRSVHTPDSIPRSSSSCFECGGTRGGVTGYLEEAARAYLHGRFGCKSWFRFPCGGMHSMGELNATYRVIPSAREEYSGPLTMPVIPAELAAEAADSLGSHCLRKVGHLFLSGKWSNRKQYPLPTDLSAISMMVRRSSPSTCRRRRTVSPIV